MVANLTISSCAGRAGILGVALALALTGANAFAHEGHDHAHDLEDHRHHDAHVHGRGEMSLAADGNMLRLELQAPAINFLGFEHAPQTDEERAAVAELKTRLNETDALFVLSREAGCQLQAAEIALPGLEEEGHGGHADVRVEYDFDCDEVAALSGVDVRLFDLYPGFEEIEVVYLLGNRQSIQTLEPGNARLTLR